MTAELQSRSGAKTGLSNDFVWLFIDANGRTGSCASEAIGSVRAAKEDDNGCRLRTFLEGQDMYAVSIVHNGDDTWCGSTGHYSRIDYVCTNAKKSLDAIQESAVDQSVDLAPSTRDDHYCLTVKLDAVALVRE